MFVGFSIRLNFDPQSGHEQSGWRPGLVISNHTFNNVTGVVIVNQVKSLDYPTTRLLTLHPPDLRG